MSSNVGIMSVNEKWGCQHDKTRFVWKFKSFLWLATPIIITTPLTIVTAWWSHRIVESLYIELDSWMNCWGRSCELNHLKRFESKQWFLHKSNKIKRYNMIIWQYRMQGYMDQHVDQFYSFIYDLIQLRESSHKIKILSLITHPHIVPHPEFTRVSRYI